MRPGSHWTNLAALTSALAFMTLGGDATRLRRPRSSAPVAITDWTAETDPSRLEPALLDNRQVAICDDHFPAGSLARTEIEEGLQLA